MKPFLNYIGSKYRYIKDYQPYFPESISGNYYEPFLGGGSVGLYVLDKFKPKHFYGNDNDNKLVRIWNTILNNDIIMNKQIISKEAFKNLVDETNANETILSDLDYTINYILINKNAFNSIMYGKGDKLSPRYSNKGCVVKDIKKLEHSKRITVSCRDYNEFLNSFEFTENDFIFLDPPYVTCWAKYMYKNGFNKDDFIKLKETLDNVECKWMLSIDNDDFIKELFNGYQIIELDRKSGITIKNANKKKEMIIRNYE